MNNLNIIKNRRVLVIDDNRSIHADFRKILCPEQATHSAMESSEAELFGETTNAEPRAFFELESAYQGQDGLTMVQQALKEGRPYAMAFVDVRMPPGMDGVETTQKLWQIDPELQIVICTAYSDYSWSEMFDKIGNNDRMVILKKPFDTVEALQLSHALTEKWQLAQQSKRKIEDLEVMVAERTRGLQGKTAFLEAQVNSSIDGILVVDGQGKTILENQRMTDLWKIPEEIRNDPDDKKLLQWLADRTKNPDLFIKTVSYLENHPTEIGRDEIELTDGTVLDRYSSPVVGTDGTYYGRIWTARDITERKRLEERVFQSQKLETVGKLAGGIAHEFNTLLTTIVGRSDMILKEISKPDCALTKNVTEIRQTAERAAVLTRQLLAYGRKQILQPEMLNLNVLLDHMKSIVRPLMGSKVDVRITPAADLKAIHADASQIEEVLMILIMNARDAMPNGGKLTMETSNVLLDEGCLPQLPELKPGPYVMVTVSDTGMGMSAEVRAHAFEPFISTKDVGAGMGLGLASCYGIIKQSGGHIIIDSEATQGTRIKIYLPQAGEAHAASTPARSPNEPPRGTETVLLVDDDPGLREMASILLQRLGYVILPMDNAENALAFLDKRGSDSLHLLVANLEMPHLEMKKLCERVRELHPESKILFTLGNNENRATRLEGLNVEAALLKKPFSPSALSFKLREVLDGLARNSNDEP